MNDRIKILHCADLHIGAELSFLNNKAASRQAEILNTFKKITRICSGQGIELLIIAGDLFDSNHIDSAALTEVKNALAAIPDTTVVITAGNHDYFAIDSPFSDDNWSQNVHIIFKKYTVLEFPEKNLRVCGSSFLGSYQEGCGKDIKAPDDSMINILVYHGELVKDEKSGRYNPISVKDIENSGFDYVALGHYHSATPVLKAGMTSYSYSGTPEGNGFDESGKKGVYAGYVYKHRAELAFVETSCRTYENVSVDISSLTTNSKIISRIHDVLKEKYGENYAENLYRISLTGKIPDGFVPASAQICTELSETLYYVRVYNKTRPDIDINILAADFSLKGIFVKKMLEKISSCSSDEEKEQYENALYIGLKAFDGEVSFYED
ncbi:DNA repair exonuclease [Ruminococcus sp. HUN007]|uniref:metallophosphoesterase family protein n=1 Tax=Ruminococcus sp. HUN007 TaxID=1514668 RepID=UPI0005D241E3|nr:DNA repair exonuclease [Ruminococcus sp. HUN007]